MIGEASYLYKRQDLIKLVTKELVEKIGNRELAGIDLSTPGVFVTKAKITSFPTPEVKIISVEQQISEMGIPEGNPVPRSARSISRDDAITGGDTLVFQFDRVSNTLKVFGGEVAWSKLEEGKGAHWVGVKIEAPLGMQLKYGQQLPACIDGVPQILKVSGEINEEYKEEVIGNRSKTDSNTEWGEPIVIDLLEIFPQLDVSPEDPPREPDPVDPPEEPKEELVETNEVVLAPLVGTAEGEGKTTEELTDSLSMVAKESLTEKAFKKIYVNIKGTGLVEHTSAGAGKAYWVGISIPQADKYYQTRNAYQNFSTVEDGKITFGEEIIWTETPDGITDDGKASFYFSVKKEGTDVGTVVAVGEKETAIYILDFTEVYRAGDTIPEVNNTENVSGDSSENIAAQSEIQPATSLMTRCCAGHRHPYPGVPLKEKPFYDLDEDEFVLTIYPRKEVQVKKDITKVTNTLVSTVLREDNFVTVYLDAQRTSHEIVINWGEEYAPEIIKVEIDSPLQDVAVKKIPKLPTEPIVDFKYPEEEQFAMADISMEVNLALGK